ncbi:hypothetical protein QNO21_12030 [Microbacterium sp. zg-Y818]|uniref:hypothetical protein n=1 Tax=unclassified Microbacterium TaxID=2609290 RepID=UPI00214AD831|nr:MULTISPECIES: hypothetical protein [unclassified Microbacterium]MCR2799851.1 hypothetical protein [Microbacterium sp. zg.Y818]WIM21834.1 hypothetical protein QNO21_12030 [Microbacterium sp. zg-Y818]
MAHADFHRMIAEEAGMDPARGIEHGMHQADAARVQERFAYVEPWQVLRRAALPSNTNCRPNSDPPWAEVEAPL